MLDKTSIIDQHDLSFDPGDKRNGSLYIGVAQEGSSTLDLPATLAALRAAGLWSATDAKTVPDEHRQAYKDQLALVDSARFGGPQGFIIARFDHPKFPSDAERWDAWRAFFTQHHGAAE